MLLLAENRLANVFKKDYTIDMDSVYSFLDFRLLLRDYYVSRKKADPRFSFRVMARRMGFSSPNYCKLIMDGRRNVGKSSIAKIADGLELHKKEAAYFSYLVFFAQAKNSIDKNYYFGLLSAIRAKTTVTAIRPEQFEYYNDWYNCVIRELIAGMPRNIDYQELADKVVPAITPRQARSSVELLMALKLIRVDATGTFVQSSPMLNTANELQSFSIRNYHNATIELARKAIETVTPEQREYSAVTARISAAGFSRIKQRLQDFRNELLQIISDDKDTTDRVCQVNLQLFPISRIFSKNRSSANRRPDMEDSHA
jgi:uncharacterized protein (TIGR02147 family)